MSSTLAVILLLNGAVVLVSMLVLWLVSLRVGDVSFIDAFWAMGFVLIAWTTWTVVPAPGMRSLVMCGLVTIWGLRLATHLFVRWLGHGRDQRYVALIAGAQWPVPLYTLVYVFLLQGALMCVVSLPLQLGQLGGVGERLAPLGWLGACVAVIGILFESIGDWQLTRFRADAAGRGRVMDRGLWRYTRHPNYFGDACFWWGLYLIACTAPGGWLSLPGPVLMTLLLVKWSGAGLLEKNLRSNRPGYEEYIRRTSAFIPWPPRP
jgi:steroid 5-alpha reductase family enzyme